MSSSIRLKKSSVTGTVPSALEWGEIAINSMDGRLYYKSSSDSQIHSLDEVQTMSCITSQALNKGEVLYASGGGGGSGKIEVSKFSASSTFGTDELYTVGLAGNSTTGTPNEAVSVVTFGKLHQVVYDDVKQTGEVNTWAVGAVLYISASTTGKLTATIPTAPNLRIAMATVVAVSGANRTLLVQFEPGRHLNEIHDIYAPSPTDGQVIKWTAINNRWEAGSVSGGSGGNSFTNIAVSGQTAIVADSSSDTLTFANGGGITLTTDVNTDTLTLAVDSNSFLSTGGGLVNGDLSVANIGGAIFNVYQGENGNSPILFTASGTDIISEECNFTGNNQQGSYNFTWYLSGGGIGLLVNGSTGEVITEGTFSSIGNILNGTSATPASSLEQAVGFTTTATTANQVIASVLGTVYRTVKFLIQVTQGTNYETTEILAIHNGTTATHTEYGNIVIGTSPASFNVDYSVGTGELRLLTTPTSASSTVFKIKITSISI